MERLLVLVQVADEGDEAALEIERTFTIGPIVQEANPEAFVEIGGLAETLGDGVERELDRLEDRWGRP